MTEQVSGEAGTSTDRAENGGGAHLVVGSPSTDCPRPSTIDVEAIRARCEAFLSTVETTGLTLQRYDRGGGRLGVFADGSARRLVADFFHEPEREFFWGAVTDLPAALDEIDRLLASAARFSALIDEVAAERDLLQEQLDDSRTAYDTLSAETTRLLAMAERGLYDGDAGRRGD